MNITLDAAKLDWMTNGNGLWAATLDDLDGNSVTFEEGYTNTVSGKLVKVTNASRPVGTITYITNDAGVSASQALYSIGEASDQQEAVSGTLTQKVLSVDLSTLTWTEDDGTYSAEVDNIKPDTTNVMCSTGQEVSVSGTTISLVSDSSPTGTLFYEAGTPVVMETTPQTLTLGEGINNLAQTDGGRTALFSLTYDGTEFTLPLDSTHKYAFSDNGTKSIITDASEQAVTGGQDMLVDVTRMFNGVSADIAAITSWADMAAVMPAYLSNVAYNEGEVVGQSGGVTTAKWNQLVQNGNFADGTEGWRFTNVTTSIVNNVLSVSYNDLTTGMNRNVNQYMVLVVGHKYCLKYSYFTNYAPLGMYSVYCGEVSGFRRYANVDDTNTWITNTLFGTVNKPSVVLYFVLLNNTHEVTVESKLKDVMLFDLTEIYGAGHEPSTVEEFEADCAKWGKDLSQYQAYDAGTPMGGSATFSALHGVGTAKDTQDVVTGEKTVKMGSVDLGMLTWGIISGTSTWGALQPSDMKLPETNEIAANIISDNYIGVASNTVSSETIINSIGVRYNGAFRCYNGSTTVPPSGMLYYELAEPTTFTETPQLLTVVNGLNNVHEQNMSITGTPLTMTYTGTDQTIATKAARVYLKDVDGTVERVTGVTSINVRGGRDNVMDLTRMFGSGLEPGTLDDFYSLFPAWRGYKLQYNAGSLLNFKGTGLKSVGFNQFSGVYSEEGKYLTSTGALTANTDYNVTDYLRAIPGQTYRLTAYGNAPSICWYTYDKTLISGTAYGHASTWQEDVFTAPANAYWVRFSVYMPLESETCFYFQWSGPRNGDYEPYWDYTRPIPTLTYFPEGMNGRGSVYDEINDRQAIRRFGVVDLGTLEWTHIDGGTYGYWESTGISSSMAKPADHSTVVPMVSSLYVATSSNDVSAGTDASLDCIGVRATSGNIRVNNGSSTVSPSGTLVYELATPVVTNFDEEVNMTARISDFGTEECLPANGYVPVTAPFRGMVLYQDDYARAITKLSENYQSQDSMDNLLTLIGPLLNGTITKTFDSANQVYTYQFTPNA